MNLIKLILIGFAMTGLTACSKTIQWEEEVLLNTGETIVVKRNGTYSYKSEPGGLDYNLTPDWRSTIEFTYKGKNYSHTDELSVILLAIDSEGKPNLIAPAGMDWGWKHNYYCVTPYYVQLKPDETGKRWTWPDQIAPWLYNLPANLLAGSAPLESDGKKLGQREREQINGSWQSSKYLLVIDPTHSTPNTCPRKK